jgi:hypothetical protein
MNVFTTKGLQRRWQELKILKVLNWCPLVEVQNSRLTTLLKFLDRWMAGLRNSLAQLKNAV